jgi:hypothetical protein
LFPLAVKHKSHIDDLAAWKKEPNHFYYEKLYDEYLKRDYEVVGVKAFLNRTSSSPPSLHLLFADN